MYYINYIYTVSVRVKRETHPQITQLPEMLVNYDNSDSARWTGFSNAWHVMFCPEPHYHPWIWTCFVFVVNLFGSGQHQTQSTGSCNMSSGKHPNLKLTHRVCASPVQQETCRCDEICRLRAFFWSDWFHPVRWRIGANRCQSLRPNGSCCLVLYALGVEVVCGNAKSFTEAGRLCGISCSSA